jgi:hypothetical protein
LLGGLILIAWFFLSIDNPAPRAFFPCVFGTGGPHMHSEIFDRFDSLVERTSYSLFKLAEHLALLALLLKLLRGL